MIAFGFAIIAEIEVRVSTQTIFTGSISRWWDSLLVLLVVVPLAWRRRRPFLVVVLMGLFMTLSPAVFRGSVLFWAGLFALMLGTYSAARYAPRPWDKLALVSPAVTLGLMPLWIPQFRVPSDYLFGAVLLLASWLAGQGIQRWQRDSRRLASALHDLQAAQEQQALAAAAQERTRIARELHDIIAHSMSVMVLQARSARLDIADDPEAAREAMRAVEGVGRQALEEMRRLLEVLRTDEEATLAPQPGLDRLDDLLAQLNQTGLSVTKVVDGDPVLLSRAQDVSAYRIVQEALTNALKHGNGGEAELHLTYRHDQLEISVSNPAATPPAAASGGHGLIGIRERAALFGGQVQAGGCPNGRYTVNVGLPISRAPA